MKNFILKILLFFVPLLLIPLILYLFIDPFKVLYKYDEQINTNKAYQITQNRDFQSTELFLDSYKKNNYDSFILGNSRSMFYRTETWNKYVNGNCFHFNASAESIYGINSKLNLLNQLNVKVKNALIIIDSGVFKEVTNSKKHLFIKHPVLSKESALVFQYYMFQGFFSKSIFAYFDLFLTGSKKSYMEQYGVINNVWKHDKKNNQLSYYVYDQQIKENPKAYYDSKMDLFYKRDSIQIFSKPSIFAEQKELLTNIQKILKIHKTNYKIVISPLYNQIKINEADLNYLTGLFGKENVFDFSGINSFTSDYYNYYETSHYRPFICDSILNIVYNERKNVRKHS